MEKDQERGLDSLKGNKRTTSQLIETVEQNTLSPQNRAHARSRLSNTGWRIDVMLNTRSEVLSYYYCTVLSSVPYRHTATLRGSRCTPCISCTSCNLPFCTAFMHTARTHVDIFVLFVLQFSVVIQIGCYCGRYICLIRHPYGDLMHAEHHTLPPHVIYNFPEMKLTRVDPRRRSLWRLRPKGADGVNCDRAPQGRLGKACQHYCTCILAGSAESIDRCRSARRGDRANRYHCNLPSACLIYSTSR